MTSITVYRRNSRACCLRIEGHSGYAESGADIVCAAVSVLVQALHIGLTEYVHIEPEVTVDDTVALIELRWSNDGKNELNVLVETILKALYETALSYKAHVKFVEVSF